MLYALLLLLFMLAAPNVKAQRLSLKTNALEYLILSPNLTVEARLSRVMSLQVGVAANPMTKPINGLRATNFRVEPELRYWFNRPMARHFLALSTTAGFYNVQGNHHIYSGSVVAAGISYGYALVLSKHWNMEAEIGVGVGHFRGFDYKDSEAKPETPNFSRTLPVPIRVGLTFGYVFK